MLYELLYTCRRDLDEYLIYC